MIGVAASTADLSIAGEFFELFKTAWEPVVPGRHYHVVLCSDQEAEHVDARVLVLFGTEHVTDTTPLPLSKRLGPVDVAANGDRFPIYGAVTQFQACRVERTLTADDRPIAYRTTNGDQTVWRIGYDLFGEIRKLLFDGQPASYAEIPTLEHHIDVLRRLLIDSCVPFVEIPPRPAEFNFICCLTHDLDFFGIRRHVFDRTLAGF